LWFHFELILERESDRNKDDAKNIFWCSVLTVFSHNISQMGMVTFARWTTKMPLSSWRRHKDTIPLMRAIRLQNTLAGVAVIGGTRMAV
jgi:hypothetical protein